MALRTIQWSNHSHRRNGTGRTIDEDGKRVQSLKGFINQAWDISEQPSEYRDADLEKAANILEHNRLGGHGAKCRVEIERRRVQKTLPEHVHQED